MAVRLPLAWGRWGKPEAPAVFAMAGVQATRIALARATMASNETRAARNADRSFRATVRQAQEIDVRIGAMSWVNRLWVSSERTAALSRGTEAPIGAWTIIRARFDGRCSPERRDDGDVSGVRRL